MQGEASAGAGSGGSDRLEGLKSKVDGLTGLMSQLDAARTAARRTRVGIVIVILLVFLGFGWVMYKSVKDFIDNEMPRLGAEVQGRMMKIAAGAVRDLGGMVRRVAPVYRAAAEKDLRESWPKMREELIAQGQDFLDGIQTNAKATLDQRLTAMAEAQKARILVEFKDLDEPTQNIVMANVETAFREATLTVFEERVQKAEADIRKVHATILEFLPEEEREPFVMRMSRIWETTLLEDLGGSKMIE
jgi:hypothetical protein